MILAEWSAMGPRPQKGTYSKAKEPPKSEEERRRHFKQRKFIPKFSDLFINKDENESDPFDALLETSNTVILAGLEYS